MKKKLPNSLINKQEKIRSETIAAVTNAIIELEAQGYNIRIRDIMDITGLSRSVFAKPHIRKILVEYGISKPKWIDAPCETEDSRCDMDTLLAEKDGYIQRLLAENDQLRYEVELLRGKIHLLMHKTAAKNQDIF